MIKQSLFWGGGVGLGEQNREF